MIKKLIETVKYSISLITICMGTFIISIFVMVVIVGIFWMIGDVIKWIF
jgi:hypothetical protein